MVEEGGRWKREKEGEGGRRNGKARVADQTAGTAERASTPLSTCLSDPQGRDEAVRLHSVTRPSGPKRTKRISHPVRFISGDLIWQIVTEAVAQEPKNSVKKGSPFWDPSIEGERAREP